MKIFTDYFSLVSYYAIHFRPKYSQHLFSNNLSPYTSHNIIDNASHQQQVTFADPNAYVPK
jgi:hypothetical protein